MPKGCAIFIGVGMCLVGHLGRQTLEHTSFPSNPLRRPDSRVLPFKASLRPAVVFLACPVRASLDVLGRKRSFLILYSLGFMRVDRFNEMRAYMPEITGSVLAKRLSRLEKSGYVKRKNQRNESRTGVIWQLTEKGKDTVLIIMSLIGHSSRWNARELF